MVVQPVVVQQPVAVQQRVIQQPVAARPAADPSVTPQTDAERAAVRDALRKARSGDSEVQVRSPAQLVVKLPREARLFVDNVACPLTSSTRSFKTPALEPGRKYFYTIRAEMVRDGQTISQSQRVIVAAGQNVNVNFGNLMAAGTAQIED